MDHQKRSSLFMTPWVLVDPGDAGVINISRYGTLCEIKTATAETRTLAAPLRAGMLCTLVMNTYGGACTITITGGLDLDGSTTIVLNGAGESVTLLSVNIGSSCVWIVQGGAYRLSGAGSGIWGSCPSPANQNYHTLVHEFYDDFKLLDTNWTVTEDDAECTQAIQDALGGTLLLTNKATTDNNAQQIAYAQETFLLAADKTLWYETSVKAAARKAGADPEIDLAIGLWAAEDITGVADNYAADGVQFVVTEGATVFKITASKDGTHTGTVTTTTALTAGWHRLGLLIDGVTSITPYIDGTPQTALTATFCDDELLSPAFMVRNGDGTITQTLEIDYVKVCQLR